MLREEYTLTVDVDSTTVIHCSGSITTQNSNGGNIRWPGDGSETWILEGDATQTIDMTFEHGRHILGTVLNNKSGGDVTIISPLSVMDYRKPDGTPLSAPANMTILSALALKGRLFLVTSLSDQCLSQEGMKLENGTIMTDGTVVFYSQLADRDGQPVNPNQVERIWMDCALMNPIAPYLHAPRSTPVKHFRLDIPMSCRRTGERTTSGFREDKRITFTSIARCFRNCGSSNPDCIT